MKSLIPGRKVFLTMLTIGTALASTPALADRNMLVPGTACQPVLASVGCIEYSNFGAYNLCSSPQIIECPVPISYKSGPPTVTSFYYIAYDRSTTANINCTLQETDGNGNSLTAIPLTRPMGDPARGRRR